MLWGTRPNEKSHSLRHEQERRGPVRGPDRPHHHDPGRARLAAADGRRERRSRATWRSRRTPRRSPIEAPSSPIAGWWPTTRSPHQRLDRQRLASRTGAPAVDPNSLRLGQRRRRASHRRRGRKPAIRTRFIIHRLLQFKEDRSALAARSRSARIQPVLKQRRFARRGRLPGRPAGLDHQAVLPDHDPGRRAAKHDQLHPSSGSVTANRWPK